MQEQAAAGKHASGRLTNAIGAFDMPASGVPRAQSGKRAPGTHDRAFDVRTRQTMTDQAPSRRKQTRKKMQRDAVRLLTCFYLLLTCNLQEIDIHEIARKFFFVCFELIQTDQGGSGRIKPD